jgi:hypothetical protein
MTGRLETIELDAIGDVLAIPCGDPAAAQDRLLPGGSCGIPLVVVSQSTQGRRRGNRRRAFVAWSRTTRLGQGMASLGRLYVKSGHVGGGDNPGPKSLHGVWAGVTVQI